MKTLTLALVSLLLSLACLAATGPFALYAVNGTIDPTVVATAGKTNSLYIKTTSPTGIFEKQDNGTTTNWVNVSVTAPGGLALDVQYNNSGVLAGDDHFGTDGSGNVELNTLKADSGIDVHGVTDLDAGQIFTDGTGDITIDGTLSVVGVSSLDNSSILTDGLGDISASTFSSQISTNNTVGLTVLADPVTQTSDYLDLGQNGMGNGNIFRVDYLGDTTIAGLLQLPIQPPASTPTCSGPQDGSLAITQLHQLCMCNGSSSSWFDANSGLTPCTF